jgi:hypothetical protein
VGNSHALVNCDRGLMYRGIRSTMLYQAFVHGQLGIEQLRAMAERVVRPLQPDGRMIDHLHSLHHQVPAVALLPVADRDHIEAGAYTEEVHLGPLITDVQFLLVQLAAGGIIHA